MLDKFISEIKKYQEQYPQDKMVLQDLYYDAKYFHEVSHQKFKGYCLIFGGMFGLSALLAKPLPILMKQGLVLGTSRVTRQLLYTVCLSYFFTHKLFNLQLEKTLHQIEHVYNKKEEEKDELVRTKIPFLLHRKSFYAQLNIFNIFFNKKSFKQQ